MKTFHLMLGAAVAVAGLAIACAADAAPAGVKVGDLTCNVASGWGFVFGSSKDLHCTYPPATAIRVSIIPARSPSSASISATPKAACWSGACSRPPPTCARARCQGDYAGATAQATVGVGVGANALIGGLDKSIALQPLSVEGSKGLNVAAGIGSISLKSAP